MKWHKVLGRGMLPVLLLDNCIKSITKHTCNAFEIDFNFSNYFRIDGNVSFSEKEWNVFKGLIKRKIKADPSYLYKLLQKHRRSAELALLYSKKIQGINPKKISDEELKKIILDFLEVNDIFIAYIYPDFAIEEILSRQLREGLRKKTKDEVELINYMCDLTSPIRENEASKENRELLKLKKNKELIEQHRQRYEWLSFYWYLGKRYTEEDIKERLKKAANTEDKEVINEEKVNNTLKKLGIKDRRTIEVITLLREISYSHTSDVEITSKAGCLARPFFEELAKRKKVEVDDLWYLTRNELFEPNFKQRISERKKGYGALLINGRFRIITGDEFERLKAKHELKTDKKEVRGMPACQGFVKGTAKVITNRKEYDRIEEGDVLVIGMTTPDAVPIMGKCAAIVTDEGGLLCHAAVIARELNKPCVIKTNNATKTFDTGDFLEVDANRGIVRKIE